MAHAETAGANHAHHFENADHEFTTCKQGMWMFLLQEVLFFSPLFVGYFIYRGLYPEAFKVGHSMLDWRLGALNTCILIASSYTMARGVYAAFSGDKKNLPRWLLATLVCGAGFCAVKYVEYTGKIAHGLLPGESFNPHGDYAKVFEGVENGNIFFSFYFCMTGLHAIHVFLGMCYLFYLYLRSLKQEFGPEYYTPVEMFGLYWHFVDLVWIYLFPILYLMG